MRHDESPAIPIEHEPGRAIALVTIEQVDRTDHRLVKTNTDDVNDIGSTFYSFGM